MDIRIITLRYSDGIQGFPEEPLHKATAGREVLEAREHFFVHGNVPHMAVVLLLGDTGEVFTKYRASDSSWKKDCEFEKLTWK
tara:strand:+ start:181 stop:429 length:249 start_codon:yes stop_codon:yes gene_type:complete